jgi:glycosyltransferase involved in cell wall biosynthesis
MRIAINAADLDHSRIDGTRIYIQNLLKNFGLQDKEDRFLIYHKNNFNPQLEFPVFGNYKIIQKPFPFWWTQTRFAWEIFRTKPDILFMPMHSIPFLRSKKTKTVVTIHDLAFKFFPDHFPKKDLRRLNFFTDFAVNNADKLIAISNSTKNDLLKIYPNIKENKIKTIYHGYDKEVFNEEISLEKKRAVRLKYGISFPRYIIYVGAIQPRKNIDTLIDAFEAVREDSSYKDLGLVIAGGLGWLHDDIIKRIERTENVIVTGRFETEELPALLANAHASVCPSLYEGFGIPIIESMACGTPVICADNSSLHEVAGEASLLFDSTLSQKLTERLLELFENEKLQNSLRKKGLERAEDFSWEKCARETLEWLKT